MLVSIKQHFNVQLKSVRKILLKRLILLGRVTGCQVNVVERKAQVPLKYSDVDERFSI